MDDFNPNSLDETELAETPEDVAVLYSWANLQGAKYRDFSASRREYRAQMRHRQAEQQRQDELRAKGDAEAAAAEAERAAREAEEAARFHEEGARRASQERHVEHFRTEQEAMQRAEAHAAELNRIAAAERIEAARRSEAVAAAESASRREAREVAEAHASAARQAARYQESESRRSTLAGPQPAAYVPGEISDPYMNEPVNLPGRLFHQPQVQPDDMRPTRHAPSREGRLLIPQPDPLDRDHLHEVKEYWVTGSVQEEAAIAAGGMRAIEQAAHRPDSQAHVTEYHSDHEPKPAARREPVNYYAEPAPYVPPMPHPPTQRVEAAFERPREQERQREIERPHKEDWFDAPAEKPARQAESRRAGVFSSKPKDTSIFGLASAKPIQDVHESEHEVLKPTKSSEGAPMYDPIPGSPRPESAAVRAARRSGPYPAAKPEQRPAPRSARGFRPDEASGVHSLLAATPAAQTPPAQTPVAPSYAAPHYPAPNLVPDSEAALPAWITSDVVAVARPAQPRGYRNEASPSRLEPVQRVEPRIDAFSQREQPRANDPYRDIEPPPTGYRRGPELPREVEALRIAEPVRPAELARAVETRREPVQADPHPSLTDTLQHSRERVAARWYALKGVFDKPEQPRRPEAMAAPVKDVPVPMLGVFSLAGGVGKTSMVATLGRALSSMGEKVLLTDTTSHGLLPFYFGASELRPGVVRRFSPPTGSSDAAISLVSYDTAGHSPDERQQDWLTSEFQVKNRGMQRQLVDVSPVSSWVVRSMAMGGATILIPVAPDMNSVISLGAVEKFFAGLTDSEGRSVQPYYVLNQFDASLPLHLDVREVMRQQLGDRLLPFVIRRSPVVSEALAEGMTVIDYAPDSPAAGDYINLAQWLRGQAAPAAEGMKNARWSER